MAHNTRPQLASAPKQAVLTRLEEATDFAKASAVSSQQAPLTVTVISLVAPSPSRAIIRVKATQTYSKAPVKTSKSLFFVPCSLFSYLLNWFTISTGWWVASRVSRQRFPSGLTLFLLEMTALMGTWTNSLLTRPMIILVFPAIAA